MTYAILVLAAVLVISWFIIYVLATRRVVKSGLPTPEEAKIVTQTQKDVDAINKDADDRQSAIQRANDDDLLESLRNEARPK